MNNNPPNGAGQPYTPPQAQAPPTPPDPAKLKEQLNTIWVPQAKIFFKQKMDEPYDGTTLSQALKGELNEKIVGEMEDIMLELLPKDLYPDQALDESFAEKLLKENNAGVFTDFLNYFVDTYAVLEHNPDQNLEQYIQLNSSKFKRIVSKLYLECNTKAADMQCPAFKPNCSIDESWLVTWWRKNEKIEEQFNLEQSSKTPEKKKEEHNNKIGKESDLKNLPNMVLKEFTPVNTIGQNTQSFYEWIELIFVPQAIQYFVDTMNSPFKQYETFITYFHDIRKSQKIEMSDFNAVLQLRKIITKMFSPIITSFPEKKDVDVAQMLIESGHVDAFKRLFSYYIKYINKEIDSDNLFTLKYVIEKFFDEIQKTDEGVTPPRPPSRSPSRPPEKVSTLPPRSSTLPPTPGSSKVGGYKKTRRHKSLLRRQRPSKYKKTPKKS